jgi:hypothetical protein
MVPPHAVGVLETTARFAGNGSENAIPVSGNPFGLLIVKLREVAPLAETEAAPNALLMVGATPTTVMVAVFEGLPVPDSFEVTGPVVLLMTPAVGPTLTLTENVQELFAPSVPPARLTVRDPGAAVMVPPHDDVRALETTARPAGNGSENPTPVSGKPFGLLIVKLREVVPLAGTEVAANALLMVGGEDRTQITARFDLSPNPASDLIGSVWLNFFPGVVTVTSIETVHEPSGGRLAPEKLTLLLPGFVPLSNVPSGQSL